MSSIWNEIFKRSKCLYCNKERLIRNKENYALMCVDCFFKTDKQYSNANLKNKLDDINGFDVSIKKIIITSLSVKDVKT